MHVIFVEPSFPANQRQFVHALADVGAAVSAVGESSAAAMPDEIRRRLVHYEQVPSVCHEPSLLEAVRRIQSRGWIDRLEAVVEAHILPVARVREAAGIPGTTVETAWFCRDKPSMKEVLRRAGVPCAQSTAVGSREEAFAFARRAGYPVILKPRAGAGASGAERVDDDAMMEDAIRRHGIDRGQSIAAEEFIEGHEGFFDALCIDGEVVHEFISHYFPGVLEAMRTRWISPQIVTTNRIDLESYRDVRELGRHVIRSLGIGTSAVHMEWFFGPKGLKFSEIGCRPPGVGMWDLYCAANDMSLYREWALAITRGRTGDRASRRYAAGMIALRPDTDGRIAGYEGLADVHQRYGDAIIDAHFPPVGTATQGVEGGYMANAWVRLRHPDYDRLREILDDVGRTIRVRARP
ncbi:MAG: ATP-grasp domain-containing protein [Phycisphaeraceae bacterium]|nr:ATP-grasp domain-containing protein [Phycisphaeraceae bacterium]